MADEDIQDQDQQTPEFDPTEIKSEMAKLQEQLADMNQQYQQNMQSVVDAVTKSQSQIDNSDDEYLTNEEKQIKAMRAEIDALKSEAPRQTQQLLKKERDLNNTVVRLANDYPEIQADAKMRQAVLDEHAKLSPGLKETAEGYELAVQRAASKAGLVPSAKRKSAERDADGFSAPGSKSGSSASAGGSKRKAKVSEKTLMIAQLLGRDINDEKVRKGLEEAAERDTYNRYR